MARKDADHDKSVTPTPSFLMSSFDESSYISLVSPSIKNIIQQLLSAIQQQAQRWITSCHLAPEKVTWDNVTVSSKTGRPEECVAISDGHTQSVFGCIKSSSNFTFPQATCYAICPLDGVEP